MNIGIDNYKDIQKQIEQLQKAPKEVIERTIKDFKQRAPAWIAQEVAKEYNIKKSEVNPKAGEKGAGRSRVEGYSVETVSITYKGRVLTPVHFGMTPKVPKQSYTLAAQVIKGQKKTWGRIKKLTKKQKANIGRNFTRQGTRTSAKSPIMLMPTGSTYIPFQRQSSKRKDVKPVKTLSLPQMVSNKTVEKGINDAIAEKLGKRFEHYAEQFLGENSK